ncbi:MAG TPA: hypothetical protein VFP25_01670 [Nitrososphaeraceae archaeon]|nr:hypothetical protein [Nitrososphaeraceae archaeon]
MPELINDIKIKNNKIIIDTIIMDGFYDNNKNFQSLLFQEIPPAIIKVRKNCRCKIINHPVINKVVKSTEK